MYTRYRGRSLGGHKKTKTSADIFAATQSHFDVSKRESVASSQHDNEFPFISRKNTGQTDKDSYLYKNMTSSELDKDEYLNSNPILKKTIMRAFGQRLSKKMMFSKDNT